MATRRLMFRLRWAVAVMVVGLSAPPAEARAQSDVAFAPEVH